MITLSLAKKLTLISAAMLVFCSFSTAWLYYHNRTRYSDAMIQNLSHNLAETIVQLLPLVNNEGYKPETLKLLFDRMMDYNPSVEVYLLDINGNIIADAAPSGSIKNKKVNLKYVSDFLNGKTFPLYGTDPKNPNEMTIFSAAPVKLGKQLKGYVYIILEGENYNHLENDALDYSVRNSMSWSVLIIILCGLAIGAIAFNIVTKPIRKLTGLVSFYHDKSINDIQHLSEIEVPSGKDEVSILKKAFIEMATKISTQWKILDLKEKQRREFVANISHDLRTPLMSIQGYIETLNYKYEKLSVAERKRYLNIALNQSIKVGGLAQQLFDLARLEHGSVVPNFESFSLTDLIQDVIQKFELEFKKREITFKIQLASDLNMIKADMFMVERILTNLIDNAVKHTPPDGLITLRVKKSESEMIVECEDNGMGIPDDLRKTLFERPSLSKTNRRDNGGLGLILVRRMLQLHGGDIKLLDTTCTCFQFTLPLIPCEKAFFDNI